MNVWKERVWWLAKADIFMDSMFVLLVLYLLHTDNPHIISLSPVDGPAGQLMILVLYNINVRRDEPVNYTRTI